jgi:NAD(P) transhydrogenase subunit alpha
MVPDVAPRLTGAGHQLTVEHDAGAFAHLRDRDYEDKGIEIAGSAGETLAKADITCKVQPPSVDEVALLPEGSALVSFMQPHQQLEIVRALAARRISAFSLDLLPRISRAQSMDALSSQSTVAGYRGVLLAADRLGRFLPMFMTAAGTVPPAKVLVLGAGVAGLQAIATARRLGAAVRAYDVRPSAREEVKSLGATFVELDLESAEGTGGYAAAQSEDFLARQRELIGNEVAAANAVVTTAAIPGRAAPVLITASMVDAMSPGSVIVDLAAETGGNCELSVAGEEIEHNGVLVVGAKNIASSLPLHASFLYARNIAEFIGLVSKDGALALNFDDEIVAATCFVHEGNVRHGETKQLLEGA